MDDLEKMYGFLKEQGHTGEDDYPTFKEHYSQPENRKKLYEFVNGKEYYRKPYEDFEGKYFPATTAGQKKNRGRRRWLGRLIQGARDGFRRYG